MLGFEPYVAITVICYLLGLGFKAYGKFPDKWIPVAEGLLGLILGAIAWVIIPDFSDNIFNALALGIVSGLSATGINQAYKQIRKDE